MNDLVTIAEVKGILKFDGNDDDVRLSLFIGAASTSILRWLNSTGDEYRDTNGVVIPGNVPDDIKSATIMLVGIMDRTPDGNENNIWETEFLPKPVEAILHSRRTPTLA